MNSLVVLKPRSENLPVLDVSTILRSLRRPAEVLDQSDELMNVLMHGVYLGKFPVLPDQNHEGELDSETPQERFLVKKSYVPHEWGMRGRDIMRLLPYVRPSLLREIYESSQTKPWTNGDDFRFYEYVGVYNGAKIRVIFHNSSLRNGEKMSYSEWISQEEYGVLRICLS